MLMSLSMLHLFAVGGDPACPPPGAAAGMSGMAHDSTHDVSAPGMHGEKAAAAPTASSPRDCASPMPDRCCVAMSSCGVAVHLRAPLRGVGPTIARASVPSEAVTMLASIVAAPEPPPPKA